MGESENLEFHWGIKRAVGGKNKKVQFYESFVYDGEEFHLYDSVYLYGDDQPEPYIGRLIKIWETPDKAKKVKILWYFRPYELSNFLGDEMADEKELFLACGEGLGLANVNPLDKSKWFKELPWRAKLEHAYEQGRLVLLQNIDPLYTSADVEELVWQAFHESCQAKMIHQISFSSPHSGQAFVVLKSKQAADSVVRKLDERCLWLHNAMPLVARVAPPLLDRQSTFVGHLSIDKFKYHFQREMREAVATSHCSQPNTIEYEMAMEWFHLQECFDKEWKMFHKKKGEELARCRKMMKSKLR